MYTKLLPLLVGILIGPMLTAQKPPENPDEYQKRYQKRIKKEVLNGVYIPSDLADAFTQLNRLIDKASREKFKTMPEEIIGKKLHFSLGRWVTHNWGFYGGSRFSHYLRKLGINHPDDMAQFVMVSYHRNLHRKKLAIKEQIAYYQEKREQEKLDRLQKGTIIYEEKRKRSKQ